MYETPHLRVIQDRLRSDGFQLSQSTVANIPVLVGEKKEFKLAWLATQQNIFIVAGAAERVAEPTIESFSHAATKYALEHYQGLPRGVQAGVTCFALLVAPSIDEKAKLWVTQRPRKHFAVFEMPCLLDTSNNTLYFYRKTPLWGGMYYKYFRQTISRYFSV